ncbi:M23 family peptidase [Rhodobacteraceae bacterium 63075]|nr:M23 family peptidase [Rhodobacteraceae bacterium 63075]
MPRLQKAARPALIRRVGVLLTLAMASGAAAEEPPRFALPVDCELGESCYIQNYPDTLPAEERAADYACGPLTYDTHKGTDFALPSLRAMRAGVNVRAALGGTVLGTRDEMPDTGLDRSNPEAIAGRECGNGIVIGHGGGWVSQYCHMKRGSISVSKGDTVRTGDLLGEIGLSGRTEFAHLHFAVRRNGKVVDPFDPFDMARCAAAEATLWQETPPYTPGGILSAGFSTRVRGFGEIKAGESHAESLPRSAPALVLWGYMFGVKSGDILRLRFTGPEGFEFEHSVRLERTQAQAFRAAGKRRPQTGWNPGVYDGAIELRRDGKTLSHATTRVTITP